ncbi:MAG: DUF3189 family protein [Pelotomaculum sp.]|uniref:Hypothetical membrane protein n=1 Tax=Pelotomaculum thermopropionicum (strain DSM 13744 / JCM 10971 / SI) TaxID=370438 RepID=A5D1U8_PELTS|nr:DUF3189 family protein [Pelotomaculum sp.]BAF59792.1 hypothetical membrane protein [Pelotomaculum thermopropionicum SI]
MRKIIYFSDSKFPLAALAGAIHAGLLTAEGKPERGKLWELPFMNLRKNKEGKIITLGKDVRGSEIFAISVKGERGMVYRLIESFLEMYKIKEGELRLIDSGIKDNWLLLAGLFLCRSNFLSPVGRLLASAGIRKAYGRLAKLVQDVKAGLTNVP